MSYPSSVYNFITSIEDRHIQSYSSFEKAQTIRRIAPEKEYMYRFLVKKAKYEFTTYLMSRVRSSSQSTQWKTTQLQFLQQVQEALKMSMHPEIIFAMQDKARQVAEQEEKRKNTLV